MCFWTWTFLVEGGTWTFFVECVFVVDSVRVFLDLDFFLWSFFFCGVCSCVFGLGLFFCGVCFCC